MAPDALTRASDAAHKLTPAPNDGALATRSMAALDKISPSPTRRQESRPLRIVTPAKVMNCK